MAHLSDDELLAPALDSLRSRSWDVAGVEPMAGDVSRRRYHRLWLQGGGSAVLALYPADLRETCRRFLGTGELLAAAGVRVARVLAQDCRSGWMLLEDLGGTTLYDLEGRPWPELEPYFEAAAVTLRKIEGLSRGPLAGLNPPLDDSLLAAELRHTREHLLEPVGLLPPEGGDGGGDEQRAGPSRLELQEALDRLCRRLGEGDPVPCHRDFGARNLVPVGGGQGQGVGVGVLDHQDLRLGPPLYDLASLLNDSLFPPPEAEARLLAAAGVDDPEPYHRAAAQRTLKAVGSYAAFARRGTPRHLRLIPRTLERALRHLERTPETAPLVPGLRELWRPAQDAVHLEALLSPAEAPDGRQARGW
ncbi:MAG: phosphotransferase [Acidobacteriota bacterium]